MKIFRRILRALRLHGGHAEPVARRFLAEDEIVEELLVVIGDGERDYLTGCTERAARGLHHGWGTSIRNHYGLWDANNPHTRIDDPLDPMFPDQVSDRIIANVWRKMHCWQPLTVEMQTAEFRHQGIMP